MNKPLLMIGASIFAILSSAGTLADLKVLSHTKNGYAVAYVYKNDNVPVVGASVALENINGKKIDIKKTNASGKVIFRMPIVSQDVSAYVDGKEKHGKIMFDISNDYGSFR